MMPSVGRNTFAARVRGGPKHSTAFPWSESSCPPVIAKSKRGDHSHMTPRERTIRLNSKEPAQSLNERGPGQPGGETAGNARRRVLQNCFCISFRKRVAVRRVSWRHPTCSMPSPHSMRSGSLSVAAAPSGLDPLVNAVRGRRALLLDRGQRREGRNLESCAEMVEPAGSQRSTRVRESALQNPGQALGHPGVGAVQAVLVVHSHARRGVPKACHDVSCGGADGRRQ